MEIIERKNGVTIWRTTDAEGRIMYAVSQDRDGVAVEPAAGQVYSLRAARESAKDYQPNRDSSGRFVAGRKMHRTMIYLTAEQRAAVQTEAEKTGKPEAAVIREWIEKGRKSE